MTLYEQEQEKFSPDKEAESESQNISPNSSFAELYKSFSANFHDDLFTNTFSLTVGLQSLSTSVTSLQKGTEPQRQCRSLQHNDNNSAKIPRKQASEEIKVMLSKQISQEIMQELRRQYQDEAISGKVHTILKDLPKKIPLDRATDTSHPLAHLLQKTQPYSDSEYEAIEIIAQVPFNPRAEKSYENPLGVAELFNCATKQNKKTIVSLNTLPDFVAFRQHARDVLKFYRQYSTGEFIRSTPTPLIQPAALKPIRNEHKLLPILYRAIAKLSRVTFLLEAVHLECFYRLNELRFISLRAGGLLHTTDVTAEELFQTISVGDYFWVYELDIPEQTRNRLQDYIFRARKLYSSICRQNTLFTANKAQLLPAIAKPMTFAYVSCVKNDRFGENSAFIVVPEQPRQAVVPLKRFDFVPPPNNIILCKPRPTLGSATYLSGFPNSLEASEIIFDIYHKLHRSALHDGAVPVEFTIMTLLEYRQYNGRFDRFVNFTYDPSSSFSLVTQLFKLGLTVQQESIDQLIDQSAYAIETQFEYCDETELFTATACMRGKIHEDGWSTGASIIVIDDYTKEAFIAKITSITRKDTVLFRLGFCLNLQYSRKLRGRIFPASNNRPRICHVQLQCRAKRNFLLDFDWERALSRAKHIPGEVATSNIQAYFSKDLSSHLRHQRQDICRENSVYIDYHPYTDYDVISQDSTEMLADEDLEFGVELSEEQNYVIQKSLRVNRGLTAIYAPCGSGKTFTLAAAAANHAFKSSTEEIIILTAVTNKAVGRLAKILENILSNAKQDIPVVRYISDNCKNTVETKFDIQQFANQLMQLHGQNLTLQEVEAFGKYANYKEYTEKQATGNDNSSQHIELAESVLPTDETQSAFLRLLLGKLLLHYKPKILLCSVNSLLILFRPDGPFSAFCPQVSNVLIDDASLIAEPAFVAMMLYFMKANFIAAGDCNQMSPPALPQFNASVAKLSNEPFMECAWKAAAVDKLILCNIYRSHPVITERISQLFYKNDLCPAETLKVEDLLIHATKLTLPNQESPIVVVDLPEGEATRTSSASLVNNHEAKMTVELIMRLVESDIKQESIGVICYYKAQAILLQSMLKDASLSVSVYSVDGSQGEEFDIAIVLTTRTAVEKLDKVEGKDNLLKSVDSCLVDDKKACVALSRARQGLFVLAHLRALKSLKTGKLNNFTQFSVSEKEVTTMRRLLQQETDDRLSPQYTSQSDGSSSS